MSFAHVKPENNPWTDERVAQLKEFCAKGYSYGVIAKQMGCGFTRNAVLGKASRLGLRNGVNPHGKGFSHSTQQARSTPKPKPVALPPPTPVVITPLRIPLISIGSGQCRFPFWDDSDTSRTFPCCGHKCALGEPYCTHHRQIVMGQGTPSERAVSRRAAQWKETVGGVTKALEMSEDAREEAAALGAKVA